MKKSHYKNNRTKKHKRNYKDTLFKFIFGRVENRKWLLSLYNALSGSNCTDEKELEINTLEDIIYVNLKNDVSFLIGSEMYLLEHQSTYNPNLPLRGLIYFAQLYNKHFKRKTEQTSDGSQTLYAKDLYGRSLVKIPAPRFYVLYNGEGNLPDKVTLRLSDAFETPSEGFEWTATMLNVNIGHNEELLTACKSLQDYSTYVKLVRKYVGKKRNPNKVRAAMNRATDEAIKLNLLDGFFEIHKAEVLGMCLTEFDQKNYDINRREEGYAEGVKRGEKRGVKRGFKRGAQIKAIETARNLLKMGLSMEQIAQATNLPQKRSLP